MSGLLRSAAGTPVLTLPDPLPPDPITPVEPPFPAPVPHPSPTPTDPDPLPPL